nr:hypothetical protein [Tanacetum cinerariifolium]
MLVQGLQSEGSTVPVESHHTPSVDLTISQPPLSSPSRVPTSPHDSPLLGGHTPESDEGSLTLNELTVLFSTIGIVQESTSSPRATRDKGKAIMTESEHEQTTTKLRERQERAGYEASIRLQEQLNEKENQRIARDAEIAQRLQEEIKAAERQRMAQELFEATMRRIQDFVPMEKEGDKEVSKFAGSEGSKRDAEEELDQGSSKKQKTDEASKSVQ